MVKEILIRELGVKATVRADTLDRQIASQIEERGRKRDDAIACLPETARIAISEVGAQTERLLAVTMARKFITFEAAAAERADEDARHRREFIRRVTENKAERDPANARADGAEAKRAAKDAVTEVKDHQIARLEKKIIRLEGIVEGRERTLKELQPKPDDLPTDHIG